MADPLSPEELLPGKIVAGDSRRCLRQSAGDLLSKLGSHALVRIKGEDLLTFTQSLGAMLNAGMTLKKSLDVLAADTENPTLRQIMVELDVGLASGTQFSVLLQKYPEVFSKLYISMVIAGETAGNLPKILLRLASYIENSENLKKKVQSAMYYPSAVVIFAVIVVTFIFTFAVPRLTEIYKGLNVELPLATRVIMGIGEVLSSYWFVMFPTVGILIFLFLRFLKTTRGRKMFDTFKLEAPLIGPLSAGWPSPASRAP